MKNNQVTAKKPSISGRALVCALALCLLAAMCSGCRAADLSDVPASSISMPTVAPEETGPSSTAAQTEDSNNTEATTVPSHASATEQPESGTQPSTEDPSEATTAPTEHVHTYTSQVTPPTCTAGGFTTYTCSCGYSYNSNPTAALGHTWGEWVIDKAPTTTETGSRSRKCTVCGETETEELDILPPPTEHSHNYLAEVHQPTCTEAGYTIYTCECGDTYRADEVAATGHTWGEWVVTLEPTETEAGSKARTCSVCKETETVSIDPVVPDTTPHVHQYSSEVVLPTCTEAGFTKHVCSGCGDEYHTDEVAALGHQWKNDSNGTTHTCTVCQKVEPIPSGSAGNENTASGSQGTSSGASGSSSVSDSQSGAASQS